MTTARTRAPLPLFEQPEPSPFKRGPGRVKVCHREAAERWRREHPDGWALLESEAAAMVARGKRFGVKCLVEHVRWMLHFASECDRPTGAYKLNNSHTATFARMLIADHGDWAQFIETREAGE